MASLVFHFIICVLKRRTRIYFFRRLFLHSLSPLMSLLSHTSAIKMYDIMSCKNSLLLFFFLILWTSPFVCLFVLFLFFPQWKLSFTYFTCFTFTLRFRCFMQFSYAIFELLQIILYSFSFYCWKM